MHGKIVNRWIISHTPSWVENYYLIDKLLTITPSIALSQQHTVSHGSCMQRYRFQCLERLKGLRGMSSPSCIISMLSFSTIETPPLLVNWFSISRSNDLIKRTISFTDSDARFTTLGRITAYVRRMEESFFSFSSVHSFVVSHSSSSVEISAAVCTINCLLGLHSMKWIDLFGSLSVNRLGGSSIQPGPLGYDPSSEPISLISPCTTSLDRSCRNDGNAEREWW